MQYNGPRRAPLTKEQREANARQAAGVQVAHGATGDARRVNQPRTPDIYQPPVSGGGGITARGYFTLSLTDPGLPAGGAGMSGEVVSFDDNGSDPGYFAPVPIGAVGISVLTDGDYAAFARVRVTGCDPGDMFTVEFFPGNGLEGAGTFFADSNGNAAWGGPCSIISVFGLPLSLQLSVGQDTGTGTTPNLQQADVWISKIG